MTKRNLVPTLKCLHLNLDRIHGFFDKRPHKILQTSACIYNVDSMSLNEIACLFLQTCPCYQTLQLSWRFQMFAETVRTSAKWACEGSK